MNLHPGIPRRFDQKLMPGLLPELLPGRRGEDWESVGKARSKMLERLPVLAVREHPVQQVGTMVVVRLELGLAVVNIVAAIVVVGTVVKQRPVHASTDNTPVVAAMVGIQVPVVDIPVPVFAENTVGSQGPLHAPCTDLAPVVADILVRKDSRQGSLREPGTDLVPIVAYILVRKDRRQGSLREPGTDLGPVVVDILVVRNSMLEPFL